MAVKRFITRPGVHAQLYDGGEGLFAAALIYFERGAKNGNIILRLSAYYESKAPYAHFALSHHERGKASAKTMLGTKKPSQWQTATMPICQPVAGVGARSLHDNQGQAHPHMLFKLAAGWIKQHTGICKALRHQRFNAGRKRDRALGAAVLRAADMTFYGNSKAEHYITP